MLKKAMNVRKKTTELLTRLKELRKISIKIRVKMALTFWVPLNEVM